MGTGDEVGKVVDGWIAYGSHEGQPCKIGMDQTYRPSKIDGLINLLRLIYVH